MRRADVAAVARAMLSAGLCAVLGLASCEPGRPAPVEPLTIDRRAASAATATPAEARPAPQPAPPAPRVPASPISLQRSAAALVLTCPGDWRDVAFAVCEPQRDLVRFPPEPHVLQPGGTAAAHDAARHDYLTVRSDRPPTYDFVAYPEQYGLTAAESDAGQRACARYGISPAVASCYGEYHIQGTAIRIETLDGRPIGQHGALLVYVSRELEAVPPLFTVRHVLRVDVPAR
jgi:hypothetical protein